jgi:hypothetical protein
VLEVEDDFNGALLDERLWIPHYLPQWSSRAASAARYSVGRSELRLRIDADQAPWCPEFDGSLRVSSLQTGVFAGAVGTADGQHHFRDGLVVREEQPSRRLYTPRYGLFEVRARATADPSNMVAAWLIGYEDRPERSAEICMCEIFGRGVTPDRAEVGMGVRSFRDPGIVGDFSVERLAIDAREFHVYAAMWTPQRVAFYVDERLVKVADESPSYPMQLMLGIYEFADGSGPASPPEHYPKELVVDWFRGYRLAGDRARV